MSCIIKAVNGDKIWIVVDCKLLSSDYLPLRSRRALGPALLALTLAEFCAVQPCSNRSLSLSMRGAGTFAEFSGYPFDSIAESYSYWSRERSLVF